MADRTPTDEEQPATNPPTFTDAFDTAQDLEPGDEIEVRYAHKSAYWRDSPDQVDTVRGTLSEVRAANGVSGPRFSLVFESDHAQKYEISASADPGGYDGFPVFLYRANPRMGDHSQKGRVDSIRVAEQDAETDPDTEDTETDPDTEATETNPDTEAPVRCPGCGCWCDIQGDPALPPHLGNARCVNARCVQDVVANDVPMPSTDGGTDDEQTATDWGTTDPDPRPVEIHSDTLALLTHFALNHQDTGEVRAATETTAEALRTDQGILQVDREAVSELVEFAFHYADDTETRKAAAHGRDALLFAGFLDS